MPLCDKIKKLSAICKICGTNANYTFRTCAGQSQELIGGAEMYMPLCRECFTIKTKQQQTQASTQVLHSESGRSASTANEDLHPSTDEHLLDMDKLRENINEFNASEGKPAKEEAQLSPALDQVNLVHRSSMEMMDKKQMPAKLGSEPSDLILDYNEEFQHMSEEELRMPVQESDNSA